MFILLVFCIYLKEHFIVDLIFKLDIKFDKKVKVLKECLKDLNDVFKEKGW